MKTSKTEPKPYFHLSLFFPPLKRFSFVVFDFGVMAVVGGRGQLNDFPKQQQATTASWEHRRLTRTDPRLADSIFCMPVLLSNLPTPWLICARERISFHQLMNIHEGRVLDAQAVEKTRRPMSERCCSEDPLPPPLVPLLLSTVFPSLSEIHLFSCEL